MNYQKFSTILLLMWVPLFAAACAARSEAAIPPREVPPTPGASPTATVPRTAVIPTPDISGFLAMDLAGGDPEQGFNLAIAYQCRSCHDSPSRPDRGPQFSAVDDLPPILARGEVRIADPAYEGQATTSHEYLLESIFIPQAYRVVGEWPATMPESFAEKFTAEKLAHLLAWLETFNETDATESAGESTLDLSMDLPAGDPLLGELTALNYRCVGCHENSVYRNVNGPEFPASADRPSILERAEQRITDPNYTGRASNGQEYIVESILDPAAYQLPGDWAEIMPATYHEDLTDQDVADLLAWMATFSETAEKPTATMEP